MSILIVGGASSIGREVAREFARRRHDVYLAGRNLTEIEANASDLRIRYGVTVHCGYFDATAFESHAEFLEKAMQQLPSIDHVLVTYGYSGLEPGRDDFMDSKKIIDTDYVGAVSILTHVARKFEEKRGGHIIVVSSVAGDRGRRRNYVYGSAKAGLSAFAQGLRSRLDGAGVHVLTVKPGVVDTPMAERPTVPRFLITSPERVARDIFNATRARKDIIYTPWYWRLFMLIVKIIPEGLYKHLDF
jgi:short-subunit dehydrogenase